MLHEEVKLIDYDLSAALALAVHLVTDARATRFGQVLPQFERAVRTAAISAGDAKVPGRN